MSEPAPRLSQIADMLRDCIDAKRPGLSVLGGSGNGDVERLYLVALNGAEFIVTVTRRT